LRAETLRREKDQGFAEIDLEKCLSLWSLFSSFAWPFMDCVSAFAGENGQRPEFL
jgi:hypothetical protein